MRGAIFSVRSCYFKMRDASKSGKRADVLVTSTPRDWSPYLTSGPIASEQFMDGVEDLAVQERAPQNHDC